MNVLRWFLAACFFLIAPTAFAVTLSCTVGAKTASVNISSANASRMAAWANAVYATRVRADGTVEPEPDPVLAALGGLLDGVRNNVVSWEREQARAAVPQPSPIN